MQHSGCPAQALSCTESASSLECLLMPLCQMASQPVQRLWACLGIYSAVLSQTPGTLSVPLKRRPEGLLRKLGPGRARQGWYKHCYSLQPLRSRTRTALRCHLRRLFSSTLYTCECHMFITALSFSQDGTRWHSLLSPPATRLCGRKPLLDIAHPLLLSMPLARTTAWIGTVIPLSI